MNYIVLPSLFALPPVNLAILNLPPIKCSEKSIYTCALCLKEFNYKSSLSRHFLKHSGKKYFSCNVCKKSFNRKDLLNQHRKSKRCIVKSQQYNIMGIRDNDISDTKFSDPATSQVGSFSTIDERMSISWLLADSSDSSISPDIDDCQTSSFPFYFIKFSNTTNEFNNKHETQ